MLLITGGCGFIGSNLAAALEDTHQIIVADRLGSGSKWNNLRKRKLYDLIDFEDVFGLNPKSLQAVVHLGAITDTQFTDADKIVDLNVRYSLRLFEFCSENFLPFIYASSAATYGKQQICDDKAPLHILRPLNLYAWSKHLFDRMLEGRSKPPVCIGLKFFNVYGPNEYHKGLMASVVYRYVSDPTFKLFTPIDDKEPERDFIYVDDVVNVLCWCLRQESLRGLFNVGSGEATSFLDMCTFAAKYLDKEVSPFRSAMPMGLSDTYQFSTKADLTKLRVAGYVNNFTLPSDGVYKYVTKLMSGDKYR